MYVWFIIKTQNERTINRFRHIHVRLSDSYVFIYTYHIDIKDMKQNRKLVWSQKSNTETATNIKHITNHYDLFDVRLIPKIDDFWLRIHITYYTYTIQYTRACIHTHASRLKKLRMCFNSCVENGFYRRISLNSE